MLGNELKYFAALSMPTASPNEVLSSLENLASISFPDQMQRLQYALINCASLEFSQIHFPSSLHIIGDRFCLSTPLANSKIDIPEGVTYMRGYLIMGSTSRYRSYRFTLPSSLETFGYSVFYLRDFTFGISKAIVPPALDGNPFNRSNKFPLYVPDESLEAYQTDQYWSYWAAYTHGLSQFPSDFPDDAAELGMV